MWNNRRRLVWALAAALLLDVFLVGIIAGHVVAWHRAGGPPPPGPLVPAEHVRALAPDEKARFMAAMKAHREAIHDARKEHRGLRQAAETDIAAPTFDRDKVAADLAALRQSNSAIQEATNAALIDALTDLSPRSRAALVEHGKAEMPGHP